MESKPAGFNQYNLENSQQTNLIQAALSSGLSLVAAYTTHGHQFLQETNDHRDIGEARKIYGESLSFAFAAGHFRDAFRLINQAGIYEVAALRPLERPQMATRTVVTGKGFFGLGRKTQQESYVTNVVPMRVEEAITGSDYGEEPTVILGYFATDKGMEGIENNFFRDSRGRPGNYLSAEIILPASLGNLIAEEITKNPKFIRELIDTFVRHKYSEDFVKNSWDKYAKPPYQAWDSLPGRKFYFANLIKNPQVKQLPVTEAIQRAISLT